MNFLKKDDNTKFLRLGGHNMGIHRLFDVEQVPDELVERVGLNNECRLERAQSQATGEENTMKLIPKRVSCSSEAKLLVGGSLNCRCEMRSWIEVVHVKQGSTKLPFHHGD